MRSLDENRWTESSQQNRFEIVRRLGETLGKNLNCKAPYMMPALILAFCTLSLSQQVLASHATSNHTDASNHTPKKRIPNAGAKEEAAVIDRAMHAKDFKTGLSILEKYLAVHPYAVEAYGFAAKASNEIGAAPKTIKYATQYFALKKPPVDAYIYVLRAHGYVLTNQWPKAADDLARARKMVPKLSSVWILSAAVHNKEKQFDEALSDCSKAINLNDLQGYDQRADIEFAQHKLANAAADWTEYADRTGKLGMAMSRAYALYQSGSYSDALILIDAMARSKNIKARSLAICLRANVFFKLGRMQESLQQCDEYKKLTNDDHDLDTLRYSIYWSQKDCAKSLPYLNKILKARPKERGLYLMRGDCNFCLSQYDAALADYQHVPDLVQKNIATRSNRADCNLMLGHLDEALREYDAINGLETSAKSFAKQGQCLNRLGRYKEALVYLNRAVKMAQLSANYVGWRGETYRRLKKYPRAILDFNDAVTLDKKNLLYVYTRGLCYLESNHDAEAIKDFTATLANEPLRKRALLDRARAYEKLGNKAGAEQDRVAAGKANGSVDDDFFK
jgi:tetratricopeptide (TPR) repeat protein